MAPRYFLVNVHSVTWTTRDGWDVCHSGMPSILMSDQLALNPDNAGDYVADWIERLGRSLGTDLAVNWSAYPADAWPDE